MDKRQGLTEIIVTLGDGTEQDEGLYMKIIKLIKEWFMSHIDKQLHFLWSFAIAISLSWIHPVFGVSVALAFGIGKEVLDIRKSDFSMENVWDFLADCAGILLAEGVTLCQIIF